MSVNLLSLSGDRGEEGVHGVCMGGDILGEHQSPQALNPQARRPVAIIVFLKYDLTLGKGKLKCDVRIE